MAVDPRPEQRIAKLLARAGVASRREVERMIAEGRVALNGQALDTPATLLRSLHGVTVDGQPVAAPAPARLFLFHKPNGLLVTERDPAGRPTIYDRLPRDLPRVVPVGRLDLNTEGLLLLTTDGGLKRQLELPATGVERAYRARTYGEVSQARLEELIEGVEIDGVRYGSIDANLERRTGANAWIELILTEGKNREVRRVLEHLGLQVSRLIRTRYGPFVLGELQPGEIGEVRQHDLVAFRRQLEKKQKPEYLVAVGPRSNPPRASLGEGGVAAISDLPGASRSRGAGSQREPRPKAGGGADPTPRPSKPLHPRPKRAGGPPPRASSGRIKKDEATPAKPKRPARPPRRDEPEQLNTRPPRPPRPGRATTRGPRRPGKR
ncbi:pseudouridine synthase [Sphingomonas lenta]|uniref:pseudouridine synthase n=1 Tax=Sphingomonas lenta TaxID=1141887 RepID=UPI001FE62A28|nr:pseudouridine synthase [Sphingomonas lenta]